MKVDIGTFGRSRTQETGENVTKSRVLGRQILRNPLEELEKHVYILTGRCTCPFYSGRSRPVPLSLGYAISV